MVEATLRMVDPNVPFTSVRASRGKVVRAEPVAALYEQGRVHHVGAFAKLEDQMCSFTTDFDRSRAGYSPDRVDALVWALTDLLVAEMPGWGVYEATRRQAEALAAQRKERKEQQRPIIPQPGSLEWQEWQQRQQAEREGRLHDEAISG